jgi:hypothetical protein
MGMHGLASFNHFILFLRESPGKELRMHLRQLVMPCWGFFAFALLSGCGENSGTVRVMGTVKLDGQPVEGALVTFVPVQGAGRSASGRTDETGQFRLTTLREEDGAMPGEYKAIVVYDEPVELRVAATGQQKAFAATIKAQGARKKLKYVIPGKYGDPGQTPFRFTVPVKGPVDLDVKSK